MKKRITIKIFLGMILLIGIVGFISAEIFTGVCCERLKGTNNNGAWCQVASDESQCALGLNSITGQEYKALPTSCDQTSFCTLGTCVNQREGSCQEGVPQQTCNTNNGGYWVAGNKDSVAQCQVGCCIIGDSAFIGTSTQCTYQSGLSGIQAEFDLSLKDEIQCVSSVQQNVEGACVYQNTLGTITCSRTTGKECSELTGNDISGEAEFHAGILCTDQDLNTICGPTKTTMCEDYDVYYLDSCGNKANIYDSGQYNNQSYWTYISNSAPCDDGLGNKNSKTCGQCEYFQGSICKSKSSASQNPVYGDYICSSLDCGSFDTNGNGKIETSEKDYKHGEKWCAGFSDLSKITSVDQSEWDADINLKTENLPGSRYEVLECRNGEVIATPCDPWRNEICAGDYYDLNDNNRQDNSDYKTAECVPNKWQDCIFQTTEASCEDKVNRDCIWINGTSILKDGDTGEILTTDSNGNKIMASCVPKFAPGLDITASLETEGTTSCGLVSTACAVTYEVGLFRSLGKIESAEIKDRVKYCVSNCYCIPGYKDGDAKNKYENNKPSTDPKSYEAWVSSLNLVCSALGDCGNKINYIGEKGYQRDDILDTGNFTKNKFFGN